MQWPDGFLWGTGASSNQGRVLFRARWHHSDGMADSRIGLATAPAR